MFKRPTTENQSSLNNNALSSEQVFPGAQATVVTSSSNSEINPHQQKEFFKPAGVASKRQEDLQRFMLEVYNQNSYLDVFSIGKVQRCLNKFKESLNSEEAIKILETLGNTRVRNNELNAIEIRLEEFRDKISQEQAQFQWADAMVKSWFEYALETITKLREAVGFQKETLGHKAEQLMKIKNLFNGTRNAQEIVSQSASVIEELKRLVDSAHLNSEWLYGDIESRIETILRDTQTNIDDPRISVNWQKEFFKKSGVATLQLNTLQKLLSEVYKPEMCQKVFAVSDIQSCLDKLRESLNSEEAVNTLRNLENTSVRNNELNAIGGGSLSEIKAELKCKQLQFRFSTPVVKTWFVNALEFIVKLEESIELQKKVLDYKTKQLVKVKNLFDGTRNTQEIVSQATPIIEGLKYFSGSAYLDSTQAYNYIVSRGEILNNTQMHDEDISIINHFLSVGEPGFFVSPASQNSDVAIAFRHV